LEELSENNISSRLIHPSAHATTITGLRQQVSTVINKPIEIKN
jgi:hypothetical protein